MSPYLENLGTEIFKEEKTILNSYTNECHRTTFVIIFEEPKYFHTHHHTTNMDAQIKHNICYHAPIEEIIKLVKKYHVNVKEDYIISLCEKTLLDYQATKNINHTTKKIKL